jgi:hypothetical protein
MKILTGSTARKVLFSTVPSWNAPSEKEFRAALERRIRERLGMKAADQARSWLDDLPVDRLHAVHARLPYVDDVSALVDPDWRLAAELIGVAKLARHAFGFPMTAGVLLELRPALRLSYPGELFVEIPWLEHLREAAKAAKTLAASGWAVLSCGREEVADTLSGTIDSKIVKAFRLGLTGADPRCKDHSQAVGLPDVAEAREGVGLMMTGAHRFRACKEVPRR